MAPDVTDDIALASPNPDNDSITSNIDYDIPSCFDAFNASNVLGCVKGIKKSLKEQIRDAQAITGLPLDTKLYPKIQGPDKRFYHLCVYFKLKDDPS